MKFLFEELRNRGLGLIDVHAHVSILNSKINELLIKYAKIFNIDKYVISIYPFDLEGFGHRVEDVIKANEFVKKLSEYHKIFAPMVYVNPIHSEAIKIAEKFLRNGFIGIGEIYRTIRASSRLLDPLLELAVQYDVPVLIHTAHRLYPRDRPNESRPEDLVVLARRRPRAKIIMSHLFGGGDWIYAINIVSDTPNIYVDLGGSSSDYGGIEYACRVISINRLLFASDNLLTVAIARIENSKISEDSKAKIYRENALKVFRFD